MQIYIGSDHRGFELKEKIAKWLFELQYSYQDLGANHLDQKDDYTKYAQDVASLVVADPQSCGILFCGSGVGVEVVANKFDGIRASVGKNVLQVKAGREHDNMNILTIASDFTTEKEAKAMTIAFLETKFDEKPRHEARLEEISKIEANN